MKFLLVFIATLFFANQASADILFLDLNFALAEIAAIKQIARSRRENVYIFPERTQAQQDKIGGLYLQAERIKSNYVACLKNPEGRNCEPIYKEYIAKFEEVQAEADKLKKVDGKEIERILQLAKENQIKFNSMVFSGHSGGTGFFGGLFGQLTPEEVVAAAKNHPGVIEDVTSIFLWGCYSGTLHSLNEVWRKNFPDAKLIVGYENQAPLGIRESSGILLRGVYEKEVKLIQARSLREAHQIFKSINLVADLDLTAILGDYYLTYDQANSISEMLKRCDSFDPNLLEKFECYENGATGCAMPPASRQGPLRVLYSFLQMNRHCFVRLKEKYTNLPSPDYVVRLIFLDNVKRNFEAHHANEDAAFRELLKDSNLSNEYSLSQFFHSNRAEDNALRERFGSDQVKLGFRDYSVLDNPSWPNYFRAGNAFYSAVSIVGPSWMRGAMAFHCVPFSWVEPGATEKDSCGLKEVLHSPVLDWELRNEEVSYFLFRLNRYDNQQAFAVNQLLNQIEGKKDEFSNALKAKITVFENYNNRSTIEESWLSAVRQKLVDVSLLDDRQVVELLIANISAKISFLDQEIALAKTRKNAEIAGQVLSNERLDSLAKLEMLKKLIEN